MSQQSTLEQLKKIYIKFEILFSRSRALFAKKRDLAILRTDGIGDYILFRNFLLEIKLSGKYKNITLIGNVIWKSIAEEFDSGIVDKFVWLDRKKFDTFRNVKYRLYTIYLLSKWKFHLAVYPTYSREYGFGDMLMHLINARSKIASVGELSNITRVNKLHGDTFYTRLIPANPSIMFEFFRNKEFFNLFLEKELATNYALKTVIAEYRQKFINYVVLFVGASNKSRQWGGNSFVALASWIHEYYGYEIILCGDKNDALEWQGVGSSLPNYVNNLLGQTSLLELIDLLAQSKFVVSNETAIPHMCVALGINVFVIYNGSHFGRFTPYPLMLTDKYHVIYHPQIIKDQANYAKISNTHGYISTLDINQISVDKVKDKIDRTIKVIK